MASDDDVTQLLRAWAGGSEEALDQLTPLVYRELRRLAASYLRHESPGHTLQPTALVHEAYLRLVNQSCPDWQGRSQFFGIAARIMRQILVDHARNHHASKRGGGLQRVSFRDCLNAAADSSADLLSLNDALIELERFDPRKAKTIELHYFGGLTIQETADVLGISKPTVDRDLRVGEAWLFRHIKGKVWAPSAGLR